MNVNVLCVPLMPIGNRFKGFCTARNRLIVATIACCCTMSFALAESQIKATNLTLNRAIQLTLDEHPHLSSFVHRQAALQGVVEQAGAAERPKVGLMVEDFGGEGELSGFDHAQSTLSISWLLQGARVNQRINVAQMSASKVEVERNIAALDLAAQTARLFVQAVVNEERLKLAQQAVTYANTTIRNVKKRVSAGKSPEFEQLQAEVELAKRKLVLEDLEHEIDASLYELKAQWGGEHNAYLLEAQLERLPTVASVDQQFDLIKQNPALSLLATQARIQESEYELARIEAKPLWEFSVGVKRFEVTENMGLVAGVSLPFGRDRRSEGKMRSIQAQQSERVSEVKALERELSTQLYVLLQEIQHSQHVIQTLQEKIIPLLRKALMQAESAYASGKLAYQPWVSLLNQQLAAEQDLLNALEAIHLQHVELQRLTGTTLTF